MSSAATNKNTEFAKTTNRLRVRMLEAARKAGGGHLGGAFSIVDIIYFLYAEFLNVDAKQPRFANRDRFILSKGHSCLALYACLEEFNFLEPDEIMTFLELDSKLPGHSEHFHVPSVEITTGSLGHGIGVAAGIALAAKLNRSEWKTVCILGDGECNEGSVWESLMFIRQHNLNNLIVIIDSNKQESLDLTSNILSIDPLVSKIEAFGLTAIEIDGHSYADISEAFRKTSESQIPCVIVANTVKGKGVDFMERVTKWHYRAPSDDELALARRQLGVKL